MRRLTLSQGNMVPSLADSPSCLPEAGVGSRLSGLDSHAKMSVSNPCDSSCSPPGSLAEIGGGGIPDVIGRVPCLWAFAISFRRTRSRDRPGSTISKQNDDRLTFVQVCYQSIKISGRLLDIYRFWHQAYQTNEKASSGHNPDICDGSATSSVCACMFLTEVVVP